MHTIRFLAAVSLVVLLAGCASNDDKFTLPAGDAARGQDAFIKFRCYDCHRVHDVDLPPSEEPNQVVVELGGKVEHVNKYGELVTAIVNPSHRLAKGYTSELVSTDGQSKMTVYNDVMTVTQLADLVAFLQSHYELQTYEPTQYPTYYGP